MYIPSGGELSYLPSTPPELFIWRITVDGQGRRHFKGTGCQPAVTLPFSGGASAGPFWGEAFATNRIQKEKKTTDRLRCRRLFSSLEDP